MNNSTLGCWWVVNAESLENKGIPRFSFRFESTSVKNTNYKRETHCILMQQVKIFDEYESEWIEDKRVEDSWDINDLNMLEWLKQYL